MQATLSQVSTRNAAHSNAEFNSLYDTIRAQVRSNPKAGVKAAQQGVMNAKQQDETEWQARFYTLLAEAYTKSESYDKALTYYAKAQAIFQKYSMIDVAFVDSAVAQIYLDMDNYDEGGKVYQKLLKTVESGRLDESPRHTELKVRVYSGIARWYARKDNYTEGIRYSYLALDLCENHSIPSASILIALLTSGTISYLLDDMESAEEYFRHGLTLSIEIDDVYGRVQSLFNLARIARDMKDFSAGLGYQKQAWHEAKDKLGAIKTAGCLTVAGSVYIYLNRIELAREKLDQALSLFNKVKSESMWKGEALFGSAIVSFKEGNVEKALEQMLEMLKYLEQNNHLLKAAFCHAWLVEVYQQIGDHKKALQHYEMKVTLHDQVRGKEQQRMAARLQLEVKVQELEHKLEQSRLELYRLKQKADEQEAGLSTAANALSKDSWGSFQQEFDVLHERFKVTLMRQFPKLTPTELKVCYLLRSGLISKEIAEALSIAPTSVDVYRHRIRKKMELVSEVNLVSYLNSI